MEERGWNNNNDRGIRDQLDVRAGSGRVSFRSLEATRKKVSKSLNCGSATSYLQNVIVLFLCNFFISMPLFVPSNEGCMLHILSTTALEFGNWKRKE